MINKIIGILIANLILASCEKVPEPPPPPRPAFVTIAGNTPISNTMVLVGEVKPRFESNQGFRIKGKIIERKVDVGSMVKRGQILVRLDATDTNLSAQAASADVSAAKANYEYALAEVERQRKLFTKNFISKSALDIKEVELTTSAAKLNQMNAQASVSKNQSRYTELIADRDGVVTQIHAEPGQVIDTGEIIAKIADVKKIDVLVAVPESLVGKLKVGDKVKIKLWVAHEKTYQGTVREIAPSANSATRAFDVRVTIDAVDNTIKLGMTAGVHFAQSEDDQIIVPSTALTQVNGKTSVWVIDKNGIANPREVVAGQYTENGVIISSGLKANEMVATIGVHTLIKGQKVQPKIQSAL